MGEFWKVIPGFSRYEASSEGRIRSNIERVGFPIGHVLKGGVSGSGYRYVATAADNDPPGRTRTRPVHHLVALAFWGPRPSERAEIRHLNGDRLDNRAANLAYGTRSENVCDALAHGTHFNGSKTHCKHGHEFTPENTKVATTGQRVCRACRRVIHARRRDKQARERVGQ